MSFKYEVGQNVYTAEDIRGWFDYSVKEYIPANTVGIIMDRDESDGNHYLIKFFGKNKEFGTQYIRESSLKLG